MEHGPTEQRKFSLADAVRRLSDSNRVEFNRRVDILTAVAEMAADLWPEIEALDKDGRARGMSNKLQLAMTALALIGGILAYPPDWLGLGVHRTGYGLIGIAIATWVVVAGRANAFAQTHRDLRAKEWPLLVDWRKAGGTLADYNELKRLTLQLQGSGVSDADYSERFGERSTKRDDLWISIQCAAFQRATGDWPTTDAGQRI